MINSSRKHSLQLWADSHRLKTVDAIAAEGLSRLLEQGRKYLYGSQKYKQNREAVIALTSEHTVDHPGTMQG
jgi:hypothetical protein